MDHDMKAIVEEALSFDISDIYLSAGNPVFVRENGAVRKLPEASFKGALTEEWVRHGLGEMLGESQIERLHRQLELDFSWEFHGRRFRGNAYFQKCMPAIALRLIPERIPALEELDAPQALIRLISARQGMVLVTGRAGAGKSTTLASFLSELGKSKPEHILTLEDPIEFLHDSDGSLFSQRELGRDFLSFPMALKSALREMPDVILVGEIRDGETMGLALEAASAGALVLGTLHTNGAAETAMRVESLFPISQRESVRDTFASIFTGIFSQRLIPALSGGRVSATEVLIATPASRNLIRQGKYAQLKSLMMSGKALGMNTMEEALRNLWKRRKISEETFRLACDSSY